METSNVQYRENKKVGEEEELSRERRSVSADVGAREASDLHDVE